MPEIGSLWADHSGSSRFVGSASGVYFLRIVQNAFADASSKLRKSQERIEASDDDNLQSQVSPECFFANEEQSTPRRTDGGLQSINNNASETQTSWTFLDAPKWLPPYEAAKQLTKIYFRRWHPLAPFLHGPTVLKMLEEVYKSSNSSSTQNRSFLSRDVILHCIWNIAVLDAQDLNPVEDLNECSPKKLLPVLGLLALEDNLTSIQAILSAQLYFIATMSLRSASVTSGLAIRATVKSGLHRCPFRYPELSSLDRDMRKRVFWSAYVLDRFLSQALGQPLGIQDPDIDVCPPKSPELHQPASSTTNISTENFNPDTSTHLPKTSSVRSTSYATSKAHRAGHLQSRPVATDQPSDMGETSLNDGNIPQEERTIREQGMSVLADFVTSSRLIGRALETFHVSIHARSASAQDILSLKADIEAWGNESVFQLNESGSKSASQRHNGSHEPGAVDSNFHTFSVVRYYQLILIVNRPLLSSDQTSAEFKLALQTCINAARSILQALQTHSGDSHSVYWPEHFLALWMSGLVIAFACRLKACSIDKAIIGLSVALDLLETMRLRWLQADACLAVLNGLLDNIKQGQIVSEDNTEPHPTKRRKQPSKRQQSQPTQARVPKRARQSGDTFVNNASLPLDHTAPTHVANSNEMEHSGMNDPGKRQHALYHPSISTSATTTTYARPNLPSNQDRNIEDSAIWPTSQHDSVFTNITLPWDSYDSSATYNAYNQNYSSYNPELDAMVWGSLQQLITNGNENF